ncbi:MAG: hypothetical protein KA184_11385 [Candidatus Hydrogenedentes bacterium]|nr:hypothetical protein [Candidatus Hydrogenedentota bacterium]
MNSVVCPHCKSHRIVTTNVPRDVVVVMPCPACGELTVLFRNKAIALDKRILEQGTREERVAHCARVITEFLESGMFQIDAPPARPRRRRHRPAPEAPLPEESLAAPEPDPGISDADIEHFIKVELEQLDDPDFFRKLFG